MRFARRGRRAAHIVDGADAVFFAGGDQSRYVAWKGSALIAAVKRVYGRRGIVGGGSAGLAIQGAVIYDAVAADRYDADTHTAMQSSRRSRNASASRPVSSHGRRSSARSPIRTSSCAIVSDDWSCFSRAFCRRVTAAGGAIYGLGIDQASAVVVDPDGTATVYNAAGGRGAYLARATARRISNRAAGALHGGGLARRPQRRTIQPPDEIHAVAVVRSDRRRFGANLQPRSVRTMIVEVTRGEIVESVHRVAACASDDRGNVVLERGEIDVPVYLRSTAKPFIAAAAVRAGVVERFGFDTHEIALMAASHNGEPFHIAAVASMLRKIGVSESALQCGPHPPYDAASAEALARDGVAFTPIHNNCSGKHAGIIALSVLLGADVANYRDPASLAQQRILELCARACGVPLDSLPLGIDGCGIPVFAVPLRKAALAFARLATLHGLDDGDARALHVVREAMMAAPEYVAGTGEFDTALMRAVPGGIVAKSGAEGVHGLAHLPSGTGLVLKVVDGAARAVPPATMELARRLEILDGTAIRTLQPFAVVAVRNRAGVRTGTIRSGGDADAADADSYGLMQRQVRALFDGEQNALGERRELRRVRLSRGSRHQLGGVLLCRSPRRSRAGAVRWSSGVHASSARARRLRRRTASPRNGGR